VKRAARTDERCSEMIATQEHEIINHRGGRNFTCTHGAWRAVPRTTKLSSL